MPRLTAVLHTYNDGRRLGRCLETLYPCDEILVVDRGSTDQTLRIAREYGAKIARAEKGWSAHDYFTKAAAEWLLCLDSRESLTEGLAASLFEWKTQSLRSQAKAFAFFLREETGGGWLANPNPQTRLVPANWQKWKGALPADEPSATSLEGEVLRFTFP